MSDDIINWIKRGGIELDPRVRELVLALNEIPGVMTHFSCEGHGVEDNWYVNFTLERNEHGWRALYKIAEVLNHSQDLMLLVESGRNFILRGTCKDDLDVLPELIRERFSPRKNE